MRLNQFIAETGTCSRREADRLIVIGEVKVNGAVALLGQTVGDADIITVSGVRIVRKTEKVYILLNKPEGITSTTDPSDKDNIADFVNYPARLFTVGRLDKDSSGAIILTDDGLSVNALLRSKNDHEKVYRVRVDKPLNREFLAKMSSGVRIYNPVGDCMVTTKPCKTAAIDNYSFEITLTQGYNRQIRRMAKACGYKVLSLVRTRFLFLSIDGLKKGEWRKLTAEEVLKIQRIISASPVKV